MHLQLEIITLDENEMSHHFFRKLKNMCIHKGVKLNIVSDRSVVLTQIQKNIPVIAIICSTGIFPEDGMHLVRQVRRLGPNIFIILITKYSSEERVIAALKAGVNDYYKEPFENKRLIECINKFLRDLTFKPLSLPQTSEQSGYGGSERG